MSLRDMTARSCSCALVVAAGTAASFAASENARIGVGSLASHSDCSAACVIGTGADAETRKVGFFTDLREVNKPVGFDSAQEARVLEMIEAQTFWALPASHREKIAAALAAQGESVPGAAEDAQKLDPRLKGHDKALTADEFDAAWAAVEPIAGIARGDFEAFKPIHQRMVAHLAKKAKAGELMAAPCFAPGTDEKLVRAVSEIITFGRAFEDPSDPGDPLQFEQTDRWGSTALDPSGGGQGEPTTLTYSFPPDGTFIPSGVGEPSGDNDLNSTLDAIYGSRSEWRELYDRIFDRWEELSGNTYVFEPNDDGASLFNADGVAGVRGDLRMTGKPIDGNSGTLAYNFFPQVGDMVIDTADGFYNNTGGDSIRLRNVLSHEHGHGMGQLHTCPVQNNKLMEPFININFDGPQFDDILNAQRHYGDPLEPNDDAGSAIALGTLSANDTETVTGVSIDDDNDVDVYQVTLADQSRLVATITPLTEDYEAGPQTGSCSESQPYNPLIFLDPAVEILDSDGVTVLASADDNPAGESDAAQPVLDPGTYFIRATGGSPSGDQIIAYQLDVEAAFAGAEINVAGGLPTELSPGEPETVTISIDENADTILGAPQLNFRAAGEASFSSVGFTSDGDGGLAATLPGFNCGDNPELFVSVETQVEGTLQFPTQGTQAARVLTSFDTLVDNAETNIGWTVSGDAIEGVWERGVPQNNGRDDPPADFDGSGQAWLTGQEPFDDNSDVDGGETILTSPVFDYSSGGTISYAYWAEDSVNPIGSEDGFFAEYSTNGGATWIRIRDYSTAFGWRTDTIDVDTEIGTPETLQIRFIARDDEPGDVLEAGVDAFEFSRVECEDVETPCNAADIAEPFGALDGADVNAFIGAFGSGGSAADIAEPFGTVDGADVNAFIGAFGAGCP